MRVYEVFLKSDGKEEFRHAGSIEAATDELALVLARENYARRAEGTHMWLVDRDNICVRNPLKIQNTLSSHFNLLSCLAPKFKIGQKINNF